MDMIYSFVLLGILALNFLCIKERFGILGFVFGTLTVGLSAFSLLEANAVNVAFSPYFQMFLLLIGVLTMLFSAKYGDW